MITKHISSKKIGLLFLLAIVAYITDNALIESALVMPNLYSKSQRNDFSNFTWCSIYSIEFVDYNLDRKTTFSHNQILKWTDSQYLFRYPYT